MLTSSSPSVGAIAYGRSGIGYPIAALEAERVILNTPAGLKRVPLDAITRWEHPTTPTTPQPGHRVRLRNTNIEGVLMEVWDYVYWIQGERSTEPWATLLMDNGQRCKWKLSQLETTA